MATVLKIGPADRGRPMSLEEFLTGDFEEGYRYELIDGKLSMHPNPNAPEGMVERWLALKLHGYTLDHPKVINCVYWKARVYIPGRRGVTNPEPDVTAYRNFPWPHDLRKLRWQDLSPILVVEVLSADDPNKDLVRNVELYLQVPTIKEYWILDARRDPNRPSLRVYRRHGRQWRIIEVGSGETYTTKLLPGLELILDTRK
jgi:Uma2 family endonuclease